MRSLGGWASGTGTDAHYGSGYQVRTLYEEVRKLRYDLPTLSMPIENSPDVPK